jgi:hypothetical protein
VNLAQGYFIRARGNAFTMALARRTFMAQTGKAEGCQLSRNQAVEK